MSKKIKVLISLFFIFIILNISKPVNANTLNSISMNVNIDTSGNAHITEIWECKLTKGTELYHPYFNLGASQVSDLTVSENDKTFDTLSVWDIGASLDEKANKCGLHHTSDGVEICWGMGSYSNHIFTVKYNITNFVSNLTDSQMIYWTLIPKGFSDPIGHAYITIKAPFAIPDTTDVWGYGNYGGTAYVHDGVISMESNGSLSKSEYMTILAKFPQNSFNTTNNLNNDFNYYLDMAEEGSVKYNKTSSSSPTDIWKSLLGVLFPILICFSIPKAFKNFSFISNFSYGESGKTLPKKNNLNYYRDIPCNGDLFKAYFVATAYGLIKKKEDLMGAVILHWIKTNVVTVESDVKDGLFSSQTIIKLILNENNSAQITNPDEKNLFDKFLVASKDGILEKNEFKKYCSNHYESILKWFSDVLDTEKDKLAAENLITVIEKKSIFSSKKYIATPELKQEAINLAGLKKYLNDYSLISEREPLAVELFEDYLIYAQILGIADKVEKEFKDLYPDIVEQSNFNSYTTIHCINVYSAAGISAASSASAAASYTSGGGGFSSGGGGGRFLWWRR